MRVLLTGLGSIGSRHARLLQEHDKEIELLAYRTSSQRSDRDEIIEYTNLEEALAADPDAAFITNPTHLHVDTALQCARANCHLLVEKPLSHTMDGVDELLATVRERGLITQMGCQLRFDPVLNRAREILESDVLGQELCFRASAGSYLPEWRPGSDYRESYSANPEQGGGVVLDLIHELDYTYWLFGPPARVASELRSPDNLDIESEGIAKALVTTERGLLGSIHLDYCRRQPQRTLEVTCEDGSVTADLEAKTVAVEYPDKTDVESFEYDRDRRFEKQLDFFMKHVRSGTESTNDLQEGKEVLQFALNVKRNANHE